MDGAQLRLGDAVRPAEVEGGGELPRLSVLQVAEDGVDFLLAELRLTRFLIDGTDRPLRDR